MTEEQLLALVKFIRCEAATVSESMRLERGLDLKPKSIHEYADCSLNALNELRDVFCDKE